MCTLILSLTSLWKLSSFPFLFDNVVYGHYDRGPNYIDCGCLGGIYGQIVAVDWNHGNRDVRQVLHLEDEVHVSDMIDPQILNG